MRGEGVGQPEGGQGAYVFPDRPAAEKSAQDLQGGPSVKVIGIGDGERPGDGFPGGVDGVAGPPGFLPVRREGETGREIPEPLVDEFDLQFPGQGRAEMLRESPLVFRLDDKDRPGEPGPPGVVEGVIEDNLAGRPDRIDLFQSAVAAPDPGGQDDQ